MYRRVAELGIRKKRHTFFGFGDEYIMSKKTSELRALAWQESGSIDIVSARDIHKKWVVENAAGLGGKGPFGTWKMRHSFFGFGDEYISSTNNFSLGVYVADVYLIFPRHATSILC